MDNKSAVMPIDAIGDWESRIRRCDAFLEGAIIDRAYTVMHVAKPAARAVPRDLKEEWSDPELFATRSLAQIENTIFLGDALPQIMPNVGPDFFPALFGGEIEFCRETSYLKHFLTDWHEAENLKIDWDRNPYAAAIDRQLEVLAEAAAGRAYIGFPDFHPGADCLAAWRSPEELCTDLYDCPEAITKVLRMVNAAYFEAYDRYAGKLTALKQPCTSWMQLFSNCRWHISSCDFSYMIGKKQFDDIFLPELAAECARFRVCVHHLDGIGCLTHLDSLLTIPEIKAVQWVFGAGKGSGGDWIDVYKKIQRAKRGAIVYIRADELEFIMEQLSPEGLMLCIYGVPDSECALRILKRVGRWK